MEVLFPLNEFQLIWR